jgi:hypothetical protein
MPPRTSYPPSSAKLDVLLKSGRIDETTAELWTAEARMLIATVV